MIYTSKSRTGSVVCRGALRYLCVNAEAPDGLAPTYRKAAALVYELYGLTEEEIKIVEGS
jgi:hypothetical protein